jgi:hypothetical protein
MKQIRFEEKSNRALPFTSLGNLGEGFKPKRTIIVKEMCESEYFTVTFRGTKWFDCEIGDIVAIKNEKKVLLSISRIIGIVLVPYYFACLLNHLDWRHIDKTQSQSVINFGQLRMLSGRRMCEFYGKVDMNVTCTVVFLGREN